MKMQKLVLMFVASVTALSVIAEDATRSAAYQSSAGSHAGAGSANDQKHDSTATRQDRDGAATNASSPTHAASGQLVISNAVTELSAGTLTVTATTVGYAHVVGDAVTVNTTNGITGLSDSKLTINGGAGSNSIAGHLLINGGQLTVASDLTVEGDLRVHNAFVTIAGGATLTVEGRAIFDAQGSTTATFSLQGGLIANHDITVRNYAGAGPVSVADDGINPVVLRSNLGTICFVSNTATTNAAVQIVKNTAAVNVSALKGAIEFISNTSTANHGVLLSGAVDQFESVNMAFVSNAGGGAGNSGVFIQADFDNLTARGELLFSNNVGGDTAADAGVDCDADIVAKTLVVHSDSAATNQDVNFAGTETNYFGGAVLNVTNGTAFLNDINNVTGGPEA